MIADIAGVIVKKSQLLGITAVRGGGTGTMEKGSSIGGIDGWWLVQVIL